MRVAPRILVLIMVLLLSSAAPAIDAKEDGKTTSVCSNCHGSSPTSSTSPTLSGQPASYTPGQTYPLSIGMTTSAWGTMGGFSMSTSSGSLSNPGANAKILIGKGTHSNPNSRSWTMDWTAPSAGSGTVTIMIAVNAVNGNGVQDSGDSWNNGQFQILEGSSSNTPPTASNLVLSPANPTTSDNLVLTYTYDDANGDAESGTVILWFLDAIYENQFDGQNTISSSNTAKGQSWTVTLTPSDGTDSGDEVPLSSPVVIQNSAPVASNLQITPAAPVESDDLTASYSYSDADSDGESGTLLRWYLDGNPVSDLDGQTTVDSLMTRSGDEWSFRVTPNDGVDAGQEYSSSTIIIGSLNTPPEAQSLGISPLSPTTLDDLTAGWTYFDSDGDAKDDEELQWLLVGVHQPEYDDDNPLPASATSKGQSWSFQVRVSDGTVFSSMFTSSTSSIANSAPEASDVTISTTDPDTTGDLHLSWSYSDADGDAESGTSITWYRDGVHVPSADDSTTLDSALTARGEQWHAEVTPSDGTSSGSLISTSTLTIENSPPVVSDAQWASAQPTIFDTLSVSFNSSDADGDEIMYSWVWLKEGFRVGDLDNSTTVEGARLDVGQFWELMVTASDSFGEGQSFSLSAIIVNIDPAASFSTTADPPVAGATTTLNASGSSDADGEIVAWLWEVGSEVLSGEVVTTTLPVGTTSVNLTVIDEHGGSAHQEQSFALADPAVVSSLSVIRSGGDIELTWLWSGDETTFHVYRSTTPITSTLGVSPMASTENTSYTDAIRVEGEMHYAITVDIRGVESPTLGTGANTATIEVADLGDLVTTQHPAMLDLGWLYTSLSIIALLGAAGLAVFDRMRGGDS